MTERMADDSSAIDVHRQPIDTCDFYGNERQRYLVIHLERVTVNSTQSSRTLLSTPWA